MTIWDVIVMVAVLLLVLSFGFWVNISWWNDMKRRMGKGDQ